MRARARGSGGRSGERVAVPGIETDEGRWSRRSAVRERVGVRNARGAELSAMSRSGGAV